jgi:2-oxoglutarate dehydrogenase E1 component
VSRVVLCSGKVYFDLLAARESAQARHVALVRLEQLYPLNVPEVLAALSRYRADLELVWAQEEPANMGAWGYVDRHLAPRLPLPLEVVSRPPSASPAVGSATRHKLEQEQLTREALGEPPSRIPHLEARTAAQEH